MTKAVVHFQVPAIEEDKAGEKKGCCLFILYLMVLVLAVVRDCSVLIRDNALNVCRTTMKDAGCSSECDKSYLLILSGRKHSSRIYA